MDSLHGLAHPDLPPAHSGWSERQTLHVACAYSNPCRWRTRRETMSDFRRHLSASPNVRLYVGELAYGDRPFEVTEAGHATDFQWRTRHELWHKENLLNLIVQRFPADWQYGAWIDGDFHFTRHDWALEAVHLLQHHAWVQLFSSYANLGPKHEAGPAVDSFARRYALGQLERPDLERAYRTGYGSKGFLQAGVTGGAWAFRREAFDAVGGMLDRCVLGSADWHMAYGMVGIFDSHSETNGRLAVDGHYIDYVRAWQERAWRSTRGDVGCVDCFAVHAYHGDTRQRGYLSRRQILVRHAYDPLVDVHPDSQGVYQLTQEKPGLRDAIRAYFRSRDEDG